MPPDDPTPPRGSQPRLLADRYDVIEEIGSGASAITWRGHDRRLDRQVAIKILRRDGEQDDAYVQRFEREARTSASVSHGNVVNVYDVGQQDGWLYLVMQYVDGEDLKRAIQRRGPFPPEEARDVTRQILAGLGAIHRAGILHRDIKPQNVLVDREGVVRVTDFGIAQSEVDVGLTTAGTTVGTVAYMAPEQAQAGTLSEATDVYAVGVVLYELLTGVLPFGKPTAMATMLAHIQEEAIPPSRRHPGGGIPPLLDAVVRQAMVKDPAARFRSAAAMARALDGRLDEPGQATTVVATPVRGVNATRVAPAVRARDQAWPATQRPVPPPPRRAASVAPTPQAGGRGVLTAMLVLLLLAIAVVAAWTLSEYLDRGQDETPTPPQQQVAPTNAPAPTDAIIIGPPTDAPQPTPTTEPDEPTPTSEPEEPTAEPTELPIEPADGQVIEPEGTTPGG